MLDDQLVVTNVARSGFEWHALCPREGNLYTMGMGLVTPLCLGLALALPHRRVLAIDGDGSLLLNLGVLATMANSGPPNLVSFVFDNASYASTGGLPTHTAGVTDLAAAARGAGIRHACTVDSVDLFHETAAQALKEDGPWLVVVRVNPETEPVGPKLMDGRENKYRFLRYIEQTEGRTILKPSVVGRKDG